MATPLSLQTVKNITWILLGVACLLLALIFAVSQSRKVVEVIEVEQQAQEAARPVQIEKVAMDVNLGNLSEEVPPLMLKQREISIGHHEKEFRGSKFLADHKSNWTYELMQVEEEDIIRAYLSQREDRANFQYFRLETEGKPTKFVLTYGKAKDANGIKNMIASVDLQLPSSLKPKVVSFADYGDFVNDLGTDEISTGLKLRPVNLTKAALPVVPTRPTAASQTPLAGGTTTTIRERDPITQEEKIKTETSQVAPTSPTAETKPQVRQNDTQIVDPF